MEKRLRRGQLRKVSWRVVVKMRFGESEEVDGVFAVSGTTTE